MKRRICLMMLFFGMLVATAAESHAYGPYYNGYGRVGPGPRRYYGYGNGRFDNPYGPGRISPYRNFNSGNGPYGNGYMGNGYGYGNYGNGYDGYGNDYNYGNGFVYRGPLGFGLSIF